MNNQFQPGDLALVVGGSTFLGAQVQIINWVEPGQEFKDSDGARLRLNPDSVSGGWLVTNNIQSAIKLQRSLMPLKGDGLVTGEKTSQEVPA